MSRPGLHSNAPAHRSPGPSVEPEREPAAHLAVSQENLAARRKERQSTVSDGLTNVRRAGKAGVGTCSLTCEARREDPLRRGTHS